MVFIHQQPCIGGPDAEVIPITWGLGRPVAWGTSGCGSRAQLLPLVKIVDAILCLACGVVWQAGVCEHRERLLQITRDCAIERNDDGSVIAPDKSSIWTQNEPLIWNVDHHPEVRVDYCWNTNDAVVLWVRRHHVKCHQGTHFIVSARIEQQRDSNGNAVQMDLMTTKRGHRFRAFIIHQSQHVPNVSGQQI